MKKNFFKKLSFILALAMIVTALAPASGVFAAAKAPKLSATSKTLHLDDPDRGANKYDFNISNKQSGWKYLWTSSDQDVVKVNKSNGLATAAGAGTAKVSVKISDKSGEEVDTLSATVLVRDNIAKLTITNTPAGDKLAVGAENDFNRSYVTAAGLTKGSEGITRWTAADKDGKTDGATISDSGLFVASKAGEYTITARSFQSKSKYNEWLADNTKSTLVTASTTYTVKVAASMVSAKQVNSTKFTVEFDSAVTDIATKLSVNRIAGTTPVKELVKSIKVDAANKVATVELYVPFTAGTTYVVSYPDMKDVQFVAASQKVEDVARIEITTKTVEIGKIKTLDIAIYNKDDVNIANADLLNHITIKVEDSNSFPSSARDITMYAVGTTSTVTATFHTWTYDQTTGAEIGNLTASTVLTCVDQAVDNVSELNAYTVDNDTVTYPDFINSVKHTMAAGDGYTPAKQLFVQLKGTDSSGNELLIANVSTDPNWDPSKWKYTSSNDDVLIVGETTGLLYAVAPGNAVVVITYGDKIIGSAVITVSAGRELASVSLDTERLTLSNVLDEVTSVGISSVKDQLGDTYPNYHVDIDFSGNTDQGLLVYGEGDTAPYEFNANGVDAGTYTYLVTFTDNNNSSKKIVRPINVVVQKPSNTNIAYYKLEANKTSYDLKVTDSHLTEDAIFSVYAYASNNVKLSKVDLSAYTTRSVSSSNSTQPSVVDVASGSAIISILDTVTTVSGSAIQKLATGGYTVTFTNPSETIANRKTLSFSFTVTDTQAKPVISQKKTYTSAATLDAAFKDAFTVTLNGKNVTNELSSNLSDYVTNYDDGSTASIKEVYYYQTFSNGTVTLKHTIPVGKQIKYNQN